MRTDVVRLRRELNDDADNPTSSSPGDASGTRSSGGEAEQFD